MADFCQNTFEFELRPAVEGQDFLVAISNQEAVKWFELWPDWHVPAIIIYGAPGCGKSHLANLFKIKTGALTITPSLIEEVGVARILENESSCIVDDAEFGIDEETLLHLYNGLASSGGHLLMTAGKPPGLWEISLKDLESRLKSIPCVEIGLPDDMLLEAVFAKYFADRQLLVGSDVITYLLPRIERSLSMAQRIVEKIDQHSLAAGRKVTLPLVRQVLASEFELKI